MFGLYGKKFILTKFKLTRSHQGWFVIAEVMVAIVWAGGWVRERERFLLPMVVVEASIIAVVAQVATTSLW